MGPSGADLVPKWTPEWSPKSPKSNSKTIPKANQLFTNFWTNFGAVLDSGSAQAKAELGGSSLEPTPLPPGVPMMSQDGLRQAEFEVRLANRFQYINSNWKVITSALNSAHFLDLTGPVSK